MSPGADRGAIIGIKWGSSNFHAYRIAAEGDLIDDYAVPAGVASLDRAGMATVLDALLDRWPGAGQTYASGMIGSPIGWIDVPYAEAPAAAADLAAALTAATIGRLSVRIVPGISCRRDFDGAPDILRGEEIELLGTVALVGGDGLVALPGKHTKWVDLSTNRIGQFFTSMSGEMFDQLTTRGLLASIVEKDAIDGPAFLDGVAVGHSRRLGLGTLLFGARAEVIQGIRPRAKTASYIRGLLIGAEIADAQACFPSLGKTTVTLVGNRPLCLLYASALESFGITHQLINSREACVMGFRELHAAWLG